MVATRFIDEPATHSRPSVLYVNLTTGLGGPARSLGTLLESVDGRFCRILCTPKHSALAELARSGAWCDLLVPLPAHAPLRRFRLLGAAVKLAIVMLSLRRHIVVVHANGDAELRVAALGAALTRLPVVVSMRGSDINRWTRLFSSLITTVISELHWVPVSSYARDLLLESGVANHAATTVIPNAISPDQVSLTSAPPAPAPKAQGRITIGYFGGKSPQKGFLLLPEVIQLTRPASMRWLVFTGSPATGMNAEQRRVWSTLRDMPDELISVQSKRSDVASAYASCDIVFCPSYKESFGRVLIEAMANGLPVVATDIPPFRDAVGDTGAGVLVPPGDIDGFAHALQALAADEFERRTRGERGLECARAYRPEPLAQKFIELYCSLGRHGP